MNLITVNPVQYGPPGNPAHALLSCSVASLFFETTVGTVFNPSNIQAFPHISDATSVYFLVMIIVFIQTYVDF